MEARTIKEYIYNNEKIETVLEELGMHHIKWHSGYEYVTCGMPDGDNPQSTTIYNDSFLGVIAYTRDIKDAYGISDIISLVTFVRQCFFTESINWLCELFGLDYYSEEEVVDFSIAYQNKILALSKSKRKDFGEELKPISEDVLKAYLDWNNTEFLKDYIGYDTQTEFELGVDVHSHRITIPIRDELGRLVGVKGRRVWDVVDEYNPKYIYLHQCAKSKILYGLYKTLPYIKETNEIIVCESEKGVMQLWQYGFKNAVGIGGHSLSDWQVTLIAQAGAGKVIIAFDKDVTEEEIIKEGAKLSPFRQVEYTLDVNNILKEKESPMDDPDNWKELYKTRKILL